MKSRFGLLPTAALAVGSFLWHAILTFRFFPPVQFIKYSTAAQLLMKGQLEGERLVDFSPLYLYLTVAVQYLFPNASSGMLWLHTGFLSLSSALLLHILSRRFSPAVSMAGAVAFTLNSSLIIFNQVMEPEPLLLVCLVTFLFFLDGSRPASVFLAGLFFGLAAMTRPNYLIVGAVVPFYFRFRDRTTWKRPSVQFAIPVLFCVGIILLRNTITLGYFSPVIMNPGVVAYEGNHPASHGLAVVYPVLVDEMAEESRGQADYQHAIYRMFVNRIIGNEVSIQEVNTYWTRKMLNYVSDHPGRFFRFCAHKVFNIFHDYQWHDLPVTYWNEQRLGSSWIPLVPFAFVSSLAVLGILLMLPQWKNYLVFYSCFAIQTAAMTVLYASARQRISLMPVFFIFACAALNRLQENRKHWPGFVVAALSLAFIFHFQTDWMHEETHLWKRTRLSHRLLAEAYRLRNGGHYEDASLYSARSLAVAPWLIDSRRPANLSFDPPGFPETALKEQPHETDFSSQLDLGMLLLSANRPEQAERLFQDLIDGNYRLKRDQFGSSEPYFYLGCAALAQGDVQRAAGLFEEGLDRSPGDPFLLSSLASLTDDTSYTKQLFRYFDEIDANYYLGKAMLATGKAREAFECFSYVTEKLPEHRTAKIYLAAAAGAMGEPEKAVSAYRDAIRIKSDPVLLETHILSSFRSLTEMHPADAYQRYSYGVVLRQFGHYSDALAEQQAALHLDPANKEILSEIGMLEKLMQGKQ